MRLRGSTPPSCPTEAAFARRTLAPWRVMAPLSTGETVRSRHSTMRDASARWLFPPPPLLLLLVLLTMMLTMMVAFRGRDGPLIAETACRHTHYDAGDTGARLYGPWPAVAGLRVAHRPVQCVEPRRHAHHDRLVHPSWIDRKQSLGSISSSRRSDCGYGAGPSCQGQVELGGPRPTRRPRANGTPSSSVAERLPFAPT